MSFFTNIEVIARKGAEGLTPEARQEIAEAILRRAAPDGGQTDLSGKRSDAYYSFFAWLCLRALLGSCPAPLLHYFKTSACNSQVDRYCKTFVHLQSLPSARRKLACLAFLLLHPPRDPYTVFLSGLLADASFPSLSPLLLKRIRVYNKHAISTSRIAAQLLVSPNTPNRQQLRETLLARHASTGGFASAENCPPDLLATAAAHMALAGSEFDARNDLAFAEACWSPDGLFSPHPGQPQGDVEHTLYALLVLGSCRS